MAAVKSEGNITLTYNSTDITQYCNSTELSAAADRLEVTDLASTGKEYLAGIAEWTISCGGYWDATFDAVIFPDIVTPGTKRTVALAVTDAADTTITYTWTSNGEVTDASISSNVGSAIEWSATLAMTGAPTRS